MIIKDEISPPLKPAPKPLQPFRWSNWPAYLAVTAIWVILCIICWQVGLTAVSESLRSEMSGVVAGVAFMAGFAGMAIMFGASLLNLKKMKGGFERLAKGELEPDIPSVWCPVLTSARQAALALAERFHQAASSESRNRGGGGSPDNTTA